ncbi:MAG: 2-hydroxyacyl-CoA dehydratase family protein, partial [Anaerolineae bacterium]
MAEEKAVTRRKIKAAGVMKKYMADYYLELDHASRTGERKVAWCSSVGPAEILRAMGFLVYFPETHSAMLGATRMATDMIPHANALGYSPEICSYLTADIGAYVQGVTPLTRAYGIESVPRPDVLVFNTNQCRDVQDWFAWYAREFDAPLVGVRTHRGVRDVTEIHISSVAKQMEQLVALLEEVSGEPFDLDELKRVVALSRECSELWRSVLNTAAAAPS